MVARHRLGTTPREPHRTVKVLSPSFFKLRYAMGTCLHLSAACVFGRQDLGNDSVADDLVLVGQRTVRDQHW